jgi:hypothetical protein
MGFYLIKRKNKCVDPNYNRVLDYFINLSENIDSAKKEIKESISKYADLDLYLKNHSINEFNANWIATYYLAYRLAKRENDTELLNKLNEVNRKIEEYAKQNGFTTSTYDISKFDGKNIEEIKCILESEFKLSNLESISKMDFSLINEHILDLKPLLRDREGINENGGINNQEKKEGEVKSVEKKNEEEKSVDESPSTNKKQEEAKNLENKPVTIQSAHKEMNPAIIQANSNQTEKKTNEQGNVAKEVPKEEKEPPVIEKIKEKYYKKMENAEKKAEREGIKLMEKIDKKLSKLEGKVSALRIDDIDKKLGSIVGQEILNAHNKKIWEAMNKIGTIKFEIYMLNLDRNNVDVKSKISSILNKLKELNDNIKEILELNSKINNNLMKEMAELNSRISNDLVKKKRKPINKAEISAIKRQNKKLESLIEKSTLNFSHLNDKILAYERSMKEKIEKAKKKMEKYSKKLEELNNKKTENPTIKSAAKKMAGYSIASIVFGLLLEWSSLYSVALMGFGLLGFGLVAIGSTFLLISGITYAVGLYAELKNEMK